MQCVKDHLAYFRGQEYPELFSADSVRALDNVEAAYGDVASHEVIYEIRLNKEEKKIDFSFRRDDENGESWLEMDAESYVTPEVGEPCLFIDASAVRPGEENREADLAFLDKALPRLFGPGSDTGAGLRQMLWHVIESLDGRAEGLFQLGVMRGRGETDRIRVFTAGMVPDALLEVLDELEWTGDTDRLKKLLHTFEAVSCKGTFILDFDAFEDHISEKIGIEIDPDGTHPDGVLRLVSALEEEGLCLPEKAAGIRRWLTATPQTLPVILNTVSHCKLKPETDGGITAKAYLMQTDEFVLRADLLPRIPSAW